MDIWVCRVVCLQGRNYERAAGSSSCLVHRTPCRHWRHTRFFLNNRSRTGVSKCGRLHVGGSEGVNVFWVRLTCRNANLLPYWMAASPPALLVFSPPSLFVNDLEG